MFFGIIAPGKIRNNPMYESSMNPNIQQITPEAYKERTKPRFIIDVSELQRSDTDRVKAWGEALAAKHEHKFNPRWKHLEIVTSGTVKPEDIDIKQIYPFKDLHWIIFRYNKEKSGWVLYLMSKNRLLSQQFFITVESR